MALLDRLGADSVRGFRRAARERFADGVALAESGRRTGAVYQWGYAVEMTLKAAYFRFAGWTPIRPIEAGDLRAARDTAAALGFQWVGNLHSLASWARLLVAGRSSQPLRNYRDITFGDRIVAQALRLERLWNETLRYHSNRATPAEARTVREVAQWFLTSSLTL